MVTTLLLVSSALAWDGTFTVGGGPYYSGDLGVTAGAEIPTMRFLVMADRDFSIDPATELGFAYARRAPWQVFPWLEVSLALQGGLVFRFEDFTMVGLHGAPVLSFRGWPTKVEVYGELRFERYFAGAGVLQDIEPTVGVRYWIETR
jgi:hypothetical protein